MKSITQHKETIETKECTFEIYKEHSGWYANATTKNDEKFFIYKWTTARTKKAIIEQIDSSYGIVSDEDSKWEPVDDQSFRCVDCGCVQSILIGADSISDRLNFENGNIDCLGCATS